MAKKRNHRRAKKKIPILATAGMIGFAAQAYAGYKAGGLKEAAAWTIGTDADGKFHPEWLLRNVIPPAAGAVGSLVASKTGINRYMAGIPLFKL